MFSAADLTELIAERPELGVSILMPTHVSGSETQQDPLRFKNLLSEAWSQLTALGHSSADSDRVLTAAQSLMDDREFWQHQELGLAVFLAGGEIRTYTLPVSVTDQVVVRHGYHLTPLLPLVASDELFYVVTVTSQEVEMFRASRFEISRVYYEGPLSLDDQGTGSDYQNPVQASPVARPHTGSIDISHAQVYGDSPEEWRKGRLVDYARRVAVGIDQYVARDRAPVVLVASPALLGHVQRASTLTPATLWAIDTDPASMDQAQLRDSAYAVLEPHLTASREQTWGRFRALRESHDERAATDTGDLARLAQQGRIETLLISDAACSGGMLDGAQTPNPSSLDLDDLVVGTLSRSGRVRVVPSALLEEQSAAAILRF